MTENRRMLVWLGFFTIATMAFITYLALKVGGITVGDQQRFRLVFDNATGIPDSADVRVSGIQVGRVTEMDLAPEGGAEVWIGIEPRVDVHADAVAVVKAKSLLGERFIELQPGSQGAIQQSGTTITQTVTPLRMEDLGQILGPLLEGVDPDQVQQAFSSIVDLIVENREAISEGASAFASALTQMADMMNDPAKRQRLEQFLTSISDLTVRLDRTLRVNEDSLNQALAEAGPAMADLRELSAQLRELSADFPDAATEAGELLRRTNRLMARMEEMDGYKVGLILKKVLQQEGLTFSIRGYSDHELREQMEEYDNIYNLGNDAEPAPAEATDAAPESATAPIPKDGGP